MPQIFLFASPSMGPLGAQPALRLKVPLREFAGPTTINALPAAGDLLLIALYRNGAYESLEPCIYRVTALDKQSLSVELDKSYVEPIALDRIRTILNRALSDGGNLLAATEYQAILALLGQPRPTEQELLEHVRRYVAARGYYFDDETICNYHICMKTRPFVILAGLSGTGKSKLSQLYAEAIGHTVQNGRYLRLAVRPSWNDDRFLLGYLNSITGEYVTEPALDFVIQAERDRDNLYFFCLDEMNLAHVEHYFSQFLSALEEESAADRRIPLFSAATEERLNRQGKSVDHDRTVIVSANLLFTGTINVDETTQPLSDKVIDRANTIEFFEVDLDKVPDRQPPPDVLYISAPVWRSYVAQQPDPAYRAQVIEIAKILNRGALGLGYRVLREIEMFMANSRDLLEPDVAFDLQVKQRILPRVRGTLAIQPMLRDLTAYMKEHHLGRSAKRSEEMENRLKRDGYTSFWR